MNVVKATFLGELESVDPGLATRETLEQSSCFVFDVGRVMTFNDEIACSMEVTDLKLQGAIKAKPLIDLLTKLDDETIDVEQKGSELLIKAAKRRKSGIRMESEVLLPVDAIDKPDIWRDLDPDFNEAVNLVVSCASKEESQFALTCVHIACSFIEACDRFQIARYHLKTGVKQSILIKAESLKKILGFDMTQVAESGAWIHFRNEKGLIISIRRYLDNYMTLDDLLEADESDAVDLPGGLEEVIGRAQIFSGDNAISNNVIVSLKTNQIVITGEGTSGWYKEMKDITYNGPPKKFMMSPNILVEMTKRSNTCKVADNKLIIVGEKFRYSACTFIQGEVEGSEI